MATNETELGVVSWKPRSVEEYANTGARSMCQRCGETVSQQFARVFGDNEDVVHGCPSCSTVGERSEATWL